uniref:Uncharacterized protein n=1 Tax=Cacopsylla melanoneura TaxID=428564 RepID=A0A8D8UPC6_9HEMI
MVQFIFTSPVLSRSSAACAGMETVAICVPDLPNLRFFTSVSWIFVVCLMKYSISLPFMEASMSKITICEFALPDILVSIPLTLDSNSFCKVFASPFPVTITTFLSSVVFTDVTLTPMSCGSNTALIFLIVSAYVATFVPMIRASSLSRGILASVSPLGTKNSMSPSVSLKHTSKDFLICFLHFPCDTAIETEFHFSVSFCILHLLSISLIFTVSPTLLR